jgi:hypothetical protein
MNAERIYRLLLRAYPPDFRAEYGEEMVQVFRDQCRESEVRSLRFWANVIWDLARSAPALHVENTRHVEVTMKPAAILTLLFGALYMLNVGVEWGAASTQAISGTHSLSIALGAFASALLLGGAVAILLQNRQAARLSLLASLALVVAARLLFPWMSIFAQLAGFGLPVALLIALYWPGKPSPVGAA